METQTIEFSPEQLKKLQKIAEDLVPIFQTIIDTINEIVKVVVEKVREIANSLARVFLNMQLLEWLIPYPIAGYLSEKLPIRWAYKYGFNWFKKKYFNNGF